AGYVESEASNVWSVSFETRPGQIEIELSRTSSRQQPPVITVGFSGDAIAELKADQITTESFQLEPEILSNDLSSKGGKREILKFSEIPTDLVHAILSIEDRRFFDHPGVDVNGLARALLRNAGDERLGQGGSTITQQLVKNTYLN